MLTGFDSGPRRDIGAASQHPVFALGALPLGRRLAKVLDASQPQKLSLSAPLFPGRTGGKEAGLVTPG